MAAEAILSVVEKLAILAIEEVRFTRGVDEHQVQSLQQELRQMHSFLRDAEEREITSATVRTWLADIQERASDAEDLINDFILKKEQQRRRTFFKRYALVFHDFLALRKFGKEIERIQIDIRSTFDRRLTYGIENIIREENGFDSISSSAKKLREQRRTSPCSSRETMAHIIGLDEDVVLLGRQLLHQGDLRRRVTSIVGMGGSGKTTLAQAIYNNEIVRRHFHCFAWVYVSQHFEPTEILQEINKQLKGQSGQVSVSANEENVVEENLFHLRYLIVLDDVWTTDVWTRLEAKLSDSVNGSKIILTTRKRDVALHADEKPYEVKLLNEQDAWMLFQHIAFKGKGKHCPEHLEELGRRIVHKCRGLPLAIVIMGGLLRTKDESIDAWSRVCLSLPWQLNQDPMQYSSILALSYHDLTFYLKQCFLYFGIFPEGFEIPVKRLIRLWIAEGFVHPRGEEELEDIGKDYIEELVDRHIIQFTTGKETAKKFIRLPEMDQKTKMALVTLDEKSEGRNLTCRMHGLVRDLSISIAKEDNFLNVYVNNSNDTYSKTKERVHRLAVHLHDKKSPSVKGSFTNLHSLLFFDLCEGETQREENGNSLQRSIMSKCRLEWLNVLDLEGTYKPRLPKALGKLIHLRYLGLRRTWLDKLPSSVANLFNLQTLDLKSTDIRVIPRAIWGMQQLRYLYLNGGVHTRISGMYNYESLRNLQTLYGISVGEENCVRGRLEKLTNIRKLGIEGDLLSQGEELWSWIANLPRLEHLKLRSTVGELTIDPTCPQLTVGSPTSKVHSYYKVGELTVPDTLCPQFDPLRSTQIRYGSLHKLRLEGIINFSPNSRAWLSGLTKLTLIGTLHESDPMRELSCLCNLRVLRLWYNSYMGRSMVCSSGTFYSLEVLEVCWLDELRVWVVEGGAMQNLRELEINKCNNLIQLPDGLKFLINLKELRLPAMSNALNSRVLPYTGEDWYKIQHIPLISPPLYNYAAAATAFASASASAASTSSSSHRPTLCVRK